jgi:RES domain-containing protein
VITVWWIVKTRHAKDAFEGEGARINGGRWNSPGVRVAYASQSVALATLEVLVGLQASALLASYSALSARLEEKLLETLPLSALPANWRDHPPPPDTQAIGDKWARKEPHWRSGYRVSLSRRSSTSS